MDDTIFYEDTAILKVYPSWVIAEVDPDIANFYRSLIPKYIEQLGVTVELDLRKALAWCDVANMLRIQLERQDIKYFPSLREYTMLYGLNKSILDSLDKKIVIMHPGPINRGVEITSDVADSEQSIILDQVENGVAIRMAVLYLLAANKN